MEPSSSSSSSSNAQARITKQRERLKASIAREEDDPIAPYERYVNWLLEQNDDEPGTFDLELIVALEEALRAFKDDKGYRDDLRYAKLWLAYAQRVERPDVIYVYMLKAGIGCIHAQLYDDYATSLETQKRFREAEEAYRLGISRSNRGADRLKKKYREFQQRVSSKNTLEVEKRPPHIPPDEASSHGAKLYRNPLRNIVTKRSATASKAKGSAPQAAQTAASTTSVTEPTSRNESDPYAYMKAAAITSPVPGKKVEKYRFDLSLLFREGKEYSIQEARAASMGMLGKKWAPLPVAASNVPRDARVGLKDNGARPATRTNMLRMTTNLTAQLTTEPTVTINTKEALKDVFGMYNSPEKSVKMAPIALGSKHAPVRKLEPLLASQSRNNLRKITEIDDEEEKPASKPMSFQPFVDEEQKKENAPPMKFKPFVDENVSTPASRPAGGLRRALSSKDLSAAPETSKQPDADDETITIAEADKPVLTDVKPRNVFSKVFTPQAERSQTEKPVPSSIQVFRDKDSQPSGAGTALFGGGLFGGRVFSKPPATKPAILEQQKKPLATSASESSLQPTHEPVFRRNTSTPQHATFTPISRSRQPLAFVPQRPEIPEVQPQPEPVESDSESEPSAESEDYSGEEAEQQNVGDDFLEDDGQDEDYYEEPAPLGRFGQFGVMTPIAERTFECTVTTRTALGSPSKTNGNILDKQLIADEHAAAVSAERLAQELQDGEDEDEIQDEEYQNESESVDDANDIVEMTGTLSLADAIAAASSFRPSNPCNPADPKIVRALLSILPPEPDFEDLAGEEAGRFDALLSFAKKKIRRNSAKSISSLDDSGLQLALPDRNLLVREKLGEGGFGVVFQAKVVTEFPEDADDSMEMDDEDEDEDILAIKVVKPRNVWEFHILRRVHAALPTQLRASVIDPLALYAYKDESYLLLEYCSQGTLLDIVNRASDAGVSQQGACLDELLVMFFTIELCKFVEGMHGCGFIHGDLKIDNCLLRLEDVPGGPNAWSNLYQMDGGGGWRSKGLKLIDFGRAIDTRMYPAGQRFVADWKTNDCDCLQMREDQPWTYELDYFGLAGIIHCMMFGKHFDSKSVVAVSSQEPRRLKIAAQLKRYWQVDLWTRMFDTLLNPLLVRDDSSLPLVPELASLREEMEVWLENNCDRGTNTLRGLLKKVERSLL